MAEMKDAAFLAEADSWIDAHWDEIVEEIGNLVAVPSVVDFDAATPEHPSGPDAHAGMTAALDLASRLGFPTTDGRAKSAGPTSKAKAKPSSA